MAQETDYKRLWRKAKDENIKLANLLQQANERIDAQADVIAKIRDGVIKPEDIIKLQGDMLLERIANKKQEATI